MVSICKGLGFKEDGTSGDISRSDNRCGVSCNHYSVYRVCGSWLPINVNGTLSTKDRDLCPYKHICVCQTYEQCNVRKMCRTYEVQSCRRSSWSSSRDGLVKFACNYGLLVFPSTSIDNSCILVVDHHLRHVVSRSRPRPTTRRAPKEKGR